MKLPIVVDLYYNRVEVLLSLDGKGRGFNSRKDYFFYNRV